MTTARLLARVGQAAGFHFAGLSRWRRWRREEALGVPTLQAPDAAAEAGAAPRFPPLPSASGTCATPTAKSAFGVSGEPPGRCDPRNWPWHGGGRNAGGWVPPPAHSPHQPFHPGGLWPLRVLGEETDVSGKDTRTKYTQRLAAGEEAGRREWGPREQPSTQGGVFGLSGLCRAPLPPVVGARPCAGTGQSLPGGFVEGWTRPLFKRRTRKHGNTCSSLFGFFVLRLHV